MSYTGKWIHIDLSTGKHEIGETDKKLLEKYIGGKGGEYETFVLDCPIFSKRIKIIESEKIYEGNSGILEIKKVELVEK